MKRRRTLNEEQGFNKLDIHVLGWIHQHLAQCLKIQLIIFIQFKAEPAPGQVAFIPFQKRTRKIRNEEPEWTATRYCFLGWV